MRNISLRKLFSSHAYIIALSLISSIANIYAETNNESITVQETNISLSENATEQLNEQIIPEASESQQDNIQISSFITAKQLITNIQQFLSEKAHAIKEGFLATKQKLVRSITNIYTKTNNESITIQETNISLSENAIEPLSAQIIPEASESQQDNIQISSFITAKQLITNIQQFLSEKAHAIKEGFLATKQKLVRSITNIYTKTNNESITIQETNISLSENATEQLNAQITPKESEPHQDEQIAPAVAIKQLITEIQSFCNDTKQAIEEDSLDIKQKKMLLNECKSLSEQCKSLSELCQQALQDTSQHDQKDLFAMSMVSYIIEDSLQRIHSIFDTSINFNTDIDFEAKLAEYVEKAKSATQEDTQLGIKKNKQTLEIIKDFVVACNKSDLRKTNDKTLQQLYTLEMILEELAQYTLNKTVVVKNTAEFNQFIQTMRTMIFQLKTNINTGSDSGTLGLTLEINQVLIESLQKVVSSQFKTFPIPSVDEIIKKRTPEVAQEILDTLTTQNETALEKLKLQSKHAGLKWYNYVARTVYYPWDKLELSRRLPGIIGVTSLTILGAYFVNALPSDSYLRKMEVPFTNGKVWLGETPSFSLNGFSEQNPSQVGIVGKGLLAFNQLYQNPIIATVTAYTASKLYTDYYSISNYCSEKCNAITDFLLARKSSHIRDYMSLIEPKYTFDDVVGQKQIKAELNRLVKYFEDPESIDNRGLKLERGYLFTGKTRSGKSFMAEALAGEIQRAMIKKNPQEKNKLNFFVVPTEMLRQPNGFKRCMYEARFYAPCILFIDEFHLLGLQTGANNTLLGDILTELSGCITNDPKSKVFIIAATNQEDKIDKALRQSGRLGKEIRFEYPTYYDRMQHITSSLDKRGVNTFNFDLGSFAREADGCTFEDINKTIEDAFITAKFEFKPLSQTHLTNSFDRNIRHILKDYDRDMAPDELRMVSAHQAGYLLAHTLLLPNKVVSKVTTLPIQLDIKETALMKQYDTIKEGCDERLVYGGIFTYNRNTGVLPSTQEQINTCIMLLSGYAAGNVVLGQLHNSNHYLASNQHQAFEIAKKIVTQGIDIEKLDDSTKNEYYRKALALRNTCHEKAMRLMEKNKEALLLLTDILMQFREINEYQIMDFFQEIKIHKPDHDDQENFLEGDYL